MNLSKFDDYFPNFFTFGCSAMTDRIQSGPHLRRCYHLGLRNITETIHCDERYNVIKIANCLFINVYLPYDGSKDINM